METLSRLEAMLGSVSDGINLMNATLEKVSDGVQLLNTTLEQQPPKEITSDDLDTQEILGFGQNRVIFSAIKKSGGNFGGDITFDEVPINTNNCFNRRTGKFISPKSSVFFFSVSALSSASTNGKTIISVLKNDNLVMKITDGHDQDTENNVAFSWMEPMLMGDTLRLSVTGHKLRSDSNDFVHFNGYSMVIF